MHRDSLSSRRRFTQLAGSADALALARLAATDKPLAVIAATALDAQRLVEEIAWFAPQLGVCLLPDWETLPYDQFSPHQDLVSERLATLYRIQRGEFDVAVVPAPTALVRLCPPAYIAARTFFLQQGNRLDLEKLKAQLATAGYQHVTQVVAPGEVCFRGGLIDLFPMGSALPYRLDLDDDVVDSIKTFDVDSQRTVYAVKEIRLLPAREFPLDEAGRARFRGRWRELFEGDPSKKRFYRDVSNGVPAAGIEYYLPLFFESTSTIFDYLPADATLALHHDVSAAVQEFWRDANSRHKMAGGDPDRPLLAPPQLFVPAEEFFVRAKDFARVDVLETGPDPIPEKPEMGSGPVSAAPLPAVAVDRRANDPLAALKRFLDTANLRVMVAAESPGRRETMATYFSEHGLQPGSCTTFEELSSSSSGFVLCVSPLAQGFVVPSEGWAVVTEAELYAGVVRRRGRAAEKRSSVEGMLRDLSELKVGDPVVHEQHGIGRYQGLISLDFEEGQSEFLVLEYDGGDKLYVPVSQLAVIGRYSGAQPEEAPLHKLGSGQWDKAKARAARQVRDTAAELLALYAKRAARLGHAFGVRQHDLEAFAAGFGFEETPDQAQAIEAVVTDMAAGKPMDRLVCGDVGFGKTEVALRAAFVAVADQKQVVILCPTTLLAEQHLQTFSDRFAEWPVNIAELSRFRSSKETTQILKKLESGEIDVVIGTHKLLSKDVKLKRLGLVIIDEEHRFGVRQKEAMKRLRAEVDVLTLTATPIPRTLAMSLEGIRDFSVIATAPQKRLAIKTFVSPWSEGLIREAVLRELKRGGQVYFLHNEVESIERMQERLARLLPEGRIAVAHGQMRERDLERVMRDFTAQRSNVLLCSTIIETGIDIPTANTIVINRADRFGLAQLHQLRGRVGRSHHQAYAYLLTPPEEALNKNAVKRLEAIQMMEELGSGFYLAMHDLEIRGAGEILGEEQSGEIQEIGFSLYARMLERAVRKLKAGKAPELEGSVDVSTEVNLHVPALLPASYCSDVHERLSLYKRLADAETREELDALREELVDRFGELPEAARALVECHVVRIAARPLGVARIDATHEAVQLQFIKNPPLDGARVIDFIRRKGRHARLAGPEKLRVEAKLPAWQERAAAVKDILQQLAA
ncbi:MAG: transcription-repair coupling factor [Betaproteobacteria bacterium RIFCSPLOWO2_12_FULL_65_14]|nr:MAG: transcription-repair coupling factor [Betaproteobacteria bacterium RIFCSPLOWO2_12_FULL_65_14]